MKILLAILLAVAGVSVMNAPAFAAEEQQSEDTLAVTSPDGTIRAELTLDEQGTLRYYVLHNEKMIVDNGTLGIKTSLGNFTEGLEQTGEAEKETIDETYSAISGKFSTIRNHANQMTASFVLPDNDDLYLTVVFRTYDDGFAYRYELHSFDETAQPHNITIQGETGSFKIPPNAKTVSMEYQGGDFTHESFYYQKSAWELNGKIVLPFMYQMGEDWVLMNEASLDGSYTGSSLDAGSSRVTMSYPYQQGDTVATIFPLSLPWRYMVIGGISEIMENTMAENLSPAPDAQYSFDDWVKPGVASWTWMVGGFEMQRDPDAIKSYLDLAEEMGWNYFILDEGWQPNNPNYGTGNEPKYTGYFDWFDEVIAYAQKRNVGLISWVPSADLNTPEKRAERLPVWAEKGIKGIKVDFFNRESQDQVALMQDIYKDCAKYHLVVDVHGANKPTGENRTYPNLLSREAIFGEEMSNNQYTQMVFAPVIRGTLGPTDFTPRILPTGASNITCAHQLAISILYESGLTCMAGSKEDYENTFGAEFLKDLPVAWDETVGLDSTLYEYISVARRKGNTWYVATNQGEGVRTANIPLDFLGEGNYLAEIFTDTQNGRDVKRTVRVVDSTDRIREVLQQGGACVIRLTKMDKTGVQIQERQTFLQEGESARLHLLDDGQSASVRSVLWESDNEDSVSVLNGTIEAKKAGTAVITVRNAEDNSILDVCRVGVLSRAGLASDWTIIQGNDKAVLDADNPKKVVITSEAGDFAFGNIPHNKFSMDVQDQNFEISVKVNASLVKEYQTAALYVENGDGATFAAQRRYHPGLASSWGNQMFAAPYLSSRNGDLNEDNRISAQNVGEDFYLKVSKTGNVFEAYCSEDGTTWTLIGSQTTIDADWTKDLHVGIFTSNGLGLDTGAQMTFENFTLDGTVKPFIGSDEIELLLPEEPEEYAVGYGTPADELNLPQTISCVYTDGSKQNAAVSWNLETYQPEMSGRQKIEGTIAGAETDAPKAWIYVTVGVQPVEVDTEILQLAAQKARTMSLAAYESSGQEEFTQMLDQAEKLLEQADGSAKPEQTEINAAANALNEAMLALRLLPDSSLLDNN